MIDRDPSWDFLHMPGTAFLQQRLREVGLPIIRDAVENDVPRIVEMGRAFFEISGQDDIATFDDEAAAEAVRQCMSGGVVLVIEKEGALVGMAAALIYRVYVSRDDMTAQELFWWVEPEHRGAGRKLFEMLERRAKENGAASLSMIALESMKWVGRLYERAGYRPLDHTYVKRL